MPGGTGNGLAKSVLFESSENFSSVNAAFVALKGSSRPVDLGLVNERVAFSSYCPDT